MNKCQNCPASERNGFCNLSEEARGFLLANSVGIEYPRGAVLFREGYSADALYVVCTGRFKLYSTSQEGRTMILRIATSGSVLGMSAAMSETPHEITAEALEPCCVRVMQRRTLQSMLRSFPQCAIGAARTIAAEYRAAFEEARRFALPESPAGRVARLLLDWMENSETKNSTIIMPLTHEELASMTATTRETVTRTLGRFKKDGLIQSKGVVFTILRPEALARAAAC